MPLRTLSIVAALCAPLALQAQDVQIPVTARKSLELTIYESDLALVKDQRDFKLTDEQSTLAFLGVSGQIQPETVLFRTLGPESLQMVEQAFDVNVLSPQSLLQRSVGREVSVVTPNPATGKDTVERAKVLSVDQGLVLEIGGKIHTQVPGRIVFDRVPDGLHMSPTLLMTVKGPAAKDLKAERRESWDWAGMLESMPDLGAALAPLAKMHEIGMARKSKSSSMAALKVLVRP